MRAHPPTRPPASLLLPPPICQSNLTSPPGRQASLDIASSLKSMEVGCSIGISTGRAFCTLVGNEKRCQYAIYGDSVNVAARLMQRAAGRVVCDSSTCDAIRSKIDVKSLGGVVLKGKQQAREHFEICSRKRHASYRERDAEGAAKRQLKMIGREQEREALEAAVQQLVAAPASEGRVFMLEADTGMGASTLLKELKDRAVVAAADAANVGVYTGEASVQEQRSAWQLWSQVVSQALQLGERPPDSDPSIFNDYVMSFFEPEDERFVPLLYEIIPDHALDYARHPHLKKMLPEGRLRRLAALIKKLLQSVCAKAPKLLVIKDLQWGDSSSLDLLSQLAREPPPGLLLVMSCRPGAAQGSGLLASQQVRLMRLLPLSKVDTASLVAFYLREGAKVLVPPEIVHWIYEKCQGNPSYTIEIERAALSSPSDLSGRCEHIISSGTVRIDPPVREGDPFTCLLVRSLDADVIPKSIHSAICGKIDKMSDMQQLIVKVSAVIGKLFSADTLLGVFPVPIDSQTLLASMETLESTGVVERVPAALTLANMRSAFSALDSLQWTFASNMVRFSTS
eukprot:tig00021013_g17068.t1